MRWSPAWLTTSFLIAHTTLAQPTATPAASNSGSLHGHIGLEVRGFSQSPADSRQNPLQLATYVQPEWNTRWPEGGPRLRVTGFARWDDTDRERRTVDLREFLFSGGTSEHDWDMGVGKLFWGALETTHLVDIINQTDFAGDPGGEEKLGQPLISIGKRGSLGRLALLWLPMFRERVFPGADGRLRTIPRVDVSRTHFERGSRRHWENTALRFESAIRGADIGLHAYRGTAREPFFFPDVTTSGETVLRPSYPLSTQVGVDVQAAAGEWLGKAEVLHRHAAGERYWQAGIGAEYTFFSVGGSAADLGLIAEFLHDSRGRNPYNPFDRDLALGGRWAWNDFGSTEVLGVVILDPRGDLVGKVEGSRRFGSAWIARFTAWALARIPANALPLSGYRRDAFLSLAIERHF